MLTNEQRSFYQEFGYLLLPGFLSADQVRELQQVTSEFESRARQVAQSNEVFDFGTSQNGDPPRLRRIKSPHKHHDAYRKLVSDPRLVSVLRELITPNIRLYGSKLNLKSPRGGEPVLWHQDWAYYPHTNDDILNAGFLIDDMRPENGPLKVIPGSHRGPVYDHNHNGLFCGAIDPDVCDADSSKAVPLLAEAGSLTLFHARLLHVSALNTSPYARRLLLFIYAAADAWPLVGCGVPGGRSCAGRDLIEYDARIIAGEPTFCPRMEKLPVRLPFPTAPDSISIYSTQLTAPDRYFKTETALTGHHVPPDDVSPEP